ncbi:FHA domain protein [Lachnospiraceae bacterium NE2001]|nr:FHA domain protein [Lachnospiraceae bacterium NE2001]
MYTLKDKGIVQELDCGNNFAYVLVDNNQFINTDYKVLLSQTNDMFVQCMKLSYNGNIGLFYITDDYSPFSSLFANMKSDTLMTIASNLFAAIIEVRNNGFLSSQNIDVSWDKIFVNPHTLKVKLVYIPVNYSVFDNYPEFESELRSSLIKLIHNVIPDKTQKMNQFLIDLSNGSLTLKDLFNRTRGEGTDILIDPSYISSTVSSEKFKNMDAYKLVALNSPDGHFEIVLDKDNMLIGKKKEVCDAYIPFNNMISRKHCRVFIENGHYFIMDVGSVNGTKINGFKIHKEQKYPINRGDIVRLADSDFQVV